MQTQARGRLTEQMHTVRVFAREVEEVHAGKNDEKTAEERDCVYRVGGVESLEEDETCAESCRCEGDVVQWIHTTRRMSIYHLEVGREEKNLHVGAEL